MMAKRLWHSEMRHGVPITGNLQPIQPESGVQSERLTRWGARYACEAVRAEEFIDDLIDLSTAPSPVGCSMAPAGFEKPTEICLRAIWLPCCRWARNSQFAKAVGPRNSISVSIGEPGVLSAIQPLLPSKL